MKQQIFQTLKAEYDRLVNNPEFVTQYETLRSILLRSGFINFLRVFNRPFSTDGGTDVQRAAAQAHFCAGYNQALDDIMYFKELHMAEVVSGKEVPINFGAIGIALAKGDITKEDLDGNKLRTAKTSQRK